MKIKVLIVEDEIILADEIEHSLETMGYDVVGNVPRGEEAIGIAKQKDFDIALMDIRLKGDLSGIETANRIQAIKRTPIIYLTDINKKSTWEQAKKTDPAAYLIKPFNALEVDIAFQIALKNYSNRYGYDLDPKQNLKQLDQKALQVDDRVYLKEGTRYVRVMDDEIEYVKGAGSYSEIYLTNTKRHVLSYNLSQLQTEIPFTNLLRIHKSFIVNIDKIRGIEGNRVFLDTIEIPIGAMYKENFLKKVKII